MPLLSPKVSLVWIKRSEREAGSNLSFSEWKTKSQSKEEEEVQRKSSIVLGSRVNGWNEASQGTRRRSQHSADSLSKAHCRTQEGEENKVMEEASSACLRAK